MALLTASLKQIDGGFRKWNLRQSFSQSHSLSIALAFELPDSVSLTLPLFRIGCELFSS